MLILCNRNVYLPISWYLLICICTLHLRTCFFCRPLSRPPQRIMCYNIMNEICILLCQSHRFHFRVTTSRNSPFCLSLFLLPLSAFFVLYITQYTNTEHNILSFLCTHTATKYNECCWKCGQDTNFCCFSSQLLISRSIKHILLTYCSAARPGNTTRFFPRRIHRC